MYVEVVNDTETLLPSVIIEHGGNSIQEKITLTQFKPKEVRTVVLKEALIKSHKFWQRQISRIKA